MKKSIALIALAALAVAVPATLAQEKVTLKRTFTNGSKDVYKVTTKMNNVTDMSGMGMGSQEMLLDITMTNEYTYSDLKEDGTAKVDFLYKDIKVKVDGPMAEMMGGQDGVPTEMKGTGRMDAFGRFTEFKISDMPAQAMMMMGGGERSFDSFNMFSLPKGEVEIGKSFDVEMPKMPMMESAKFSGKIVGPAEYEGLSGWKAEYDGTMKMNMDLSEMMKDAPEAPPFKMTLEGDTKTKITCIIEKTSGRVLSMDVTAIGDMKVKIPDMSMELPVKSESVSTLRLKVK